MKLGIVAATIIVVFAFAGNSAGQSSDDDLRKAWEEWKHAHPREEGQARRSDDEGHRFDNFRTNLKAIRQWNEQHKAPDDVELELNDFADLNDEEFINMMLGTTANISGISDEFMEELPEGKAARAAEIDWRQRGVVSPVGNQGSCGGCWAWSVAGACEGAWALKTGRLNPLSVQQLIDCNSGNRGCNGGDTRVATRWAIANGLTGFSAYPYSGKQGSCRVNSGDAKFTRYITVPMGNEAQLALVVERYGPTSVCIDSSTAAFRFYKSGIFKDPACSTTRLNHGVLVVGFGPGYWLVKNTWGSGWGENGYMRLARNTGNACGVATYPVAVSA